MEEELSSAIVRNGIQHLKSKFNECGITSIEMTCCIVDEVDLKEIAPIFSDRMKLKSMIREFRKNNCSFDCTIESRENITKVNLSDSVFEESEPGFIEPIASTSTPKSAKKRCVENVGNKNSFDCESIEIISSNGKLMNCNPKTVIMDINYDSFLEIISSAGGPVIDKYYEENNKINGTMQNKLVTTIITNLVTSSSISLPSATISQLADHIVRKFPTESKATYFLQTTRNNKTVYAGKLYSKYKNYRNFIISVTKPTNTSTNTSTVEIAITDAELDAKLLFLKNNILPWDTILQYWQETFENRINEFRTDGLFNVINRYPILRNERGHTLIEEDFLKLFSQLPSLFTRWEKFKLVLIDQLSIEDTINKEDQINVEILKNLCKLIPKGTIRMKPSLSKENIGTPTHWKPSSVECADTFLQKISDVSEVTTILNQRAEVYKRFGLKIQPSMFYSTNEETQESQYYVSMGEVFYQFPTVLKCLDVTFKIHQVFDLTYNALCTNPWVLIQRVVYEHNTIYDARSPATCNLEKSLINAVALMNSEE